MTIWRLRLLGEPTAAGGGAERPLGRKEAALLAYVALQGPTPRSKLAGLLWPDAGEHGARADLRQLLRRTRERLGATLLAPGDPLRIAPDTETDAALLKVAAFQGRTGEVLAASGVLLEPYDFDDCPEFEDWLLSEREELASLRRAALLDAIAEHEEAGAIAEALRLSETLIRSDPISEAAHATAIRLHLRLGDRAAAHRAYERLAHVLLEELGLEPSPETAALLTAVRDGPPSGPEAPGLPTVPAMPPALLRPPLLVDRDGELARVARALHQGLTAVLAGPAGIGKSRLATEALGPAGPALRLEGLQQDAGLPLSTLDRGLARWLEEGGTSLLPVATLDDLATLLPAVRRATGDRAGGAGPADPARFRSAMAATLAALAEADLALWADDLHAFDASSFDVLVAALERVRARDGASARLRALGSVRPSELAPERRAALERSVAAGHAAWIELGPITAAGAAAFLASLALPGLGPADLEAFATRLHRHTGGNVLFMVECLKELASASDVLGGGVRLPLPQRVGRIIRQRVAHLPASAQRLALAAAIADGTFDLAVLAAMLGADPLALEGDLRTLEEAQVIQAGAFTHDLIAEALVDTAADPVRRFLQRRTAEALAEVGAEPARIARHWLEAGEGERAVPFLVGAAERSRERLAYREAGAALAEAARILEDAGRRDEAFERFAEAYDLVRHGDSSAGAEALIGALERLAAGPAQLARLEHARADLLASAGRGAPAEEAARRGLEAAAAAGDGALEALLATDLATALFARGAYAEAAHAFASRIEGARRDGDRRALAEGLANRAVALDHLARHDEAARLHREAAALLEALGDAESLVAVLTNLAVSLFETGRVREAATVHERVATLLAGAPEVGLAHLVHWANAGTCERDLDRFDRALELLERAHATARTLDYWGGAALDRHLASLRLRLGDNDGALDHARSALQAAEGRTDQELAARLQLAEVRLRQGRSPARELAAAQQRLARAPAASLAWYHLVSASHALTPSGEHPGKAVEHGRHALELAQEHALLGHVINARVTLALALLRTGDAHAALDHAAEAVRLLEHHAPRRGTRGEVLLTHWRALEAAGEPSAAALAACRAWLETTARDHVPAEHRDGFLRRNPAHRAILSAVTS